MRAWPKKTTFQVMLAVSLLVLAGLVLGVRRFFPQWVDAEVSYAQAVLEKPFADAGVAFYARNVLGAAALAVAFVLAAAAACAAVPRRWALMIAQLACALACLSAVAFTVLVFWITAVGASAHDATEVPLGLENLFWWRVRWLWPAAIVLGGGLVVYVHACRRIALAAFARDASRAPAVGDRILENFRTHGDDPRYRKSTYASLLLHSLLIILPLLWGLFARGCITPYHVPFGSGDPVVALVMRVKPKKKPKRRYFLNPNSAIYFHVPDLDESDIAEQVESDTQMTYAADMNAVHGKLGAGGGKKGGWPWGHKDGKVRFVRLQYDGEDWDDGLRSGRADANFLAEFRKMTDSDPKHVARKSEFHRISLLDDYPKGEGPPFVYMTGSGHIRTSARERKILRAYLLDGGMLFADCGYRTWHRSFVAFMRQVFPDKRLVEIPKDDPLFRYPFHFPEGPPPLWHHGGFSCLGVKHKGRWVVFYHPGDVNDAWKTGHSNLSRTLARQAHALGVNVVWYSFTRYGELMRKYRK